MVWPFPSPPSDRRKDGAVGEAPSTGISTATPLAARESCKGKVRGRRVCTHQKGISSAKSRLFKTPQTVTAPIEPEEEVAFSCARTGFPAHQPNGNEVLPASPTLSPPWLARGQGVAAPTTPRLGEAWKWPGNWLWVDLIPSDFPFCELSPSLLTSFPLLNKYVSSLGYALLHQTGKNQPLHLPLLQKSRALRQIGHNHPWVEM